MSQDVIQAAIAVVEGQLGSILRENERLRTEISRLRRELHRDELTQLWNRRALLERRERSQYRGWLVMADMNGLKMLNDTLGHEAADRYIIEFSEWLRNAVRQVREGTYEGPDRRCRKTPADAMPIRVHGDEFMVWVTSKDGAQKIRDRIRAWRSSDGRVSVAAGMGREVVEADEAMYRHKAAVKGRVAA